MYIKIVLTQRCNFVSDLSLSVIHVVIVVTLLVASGSRQDMLEGVISDFQEYWYHVVVFLLVQYSVECKH